VGNDETDSRQAFFFNQITKALRQRDRFW